RGQTAAAPRVPRAAGSRFEDTDRWARGRVLAALAAGEGLPAQIAPERLARVVAALEREGLVERGPAGVSLPGRPPS
ncbi:MAG TPA: A/G-specific adenine glycosylase, partial [Solirubrobacteraceae bacterium]|nr:A/G-specific adenine glycosylase [Solirubrobacteraceae bacterium]